MNLKQKVAGIKDPPKKQFASQKEHDDHHRPAAVASLSPDERAEYDNQEQTNKSGDAYLALKGKVPPYKPAKSTSNLAPAAQYAYQSDKTSTPLKNKIKNMRAQQYVAGSQD